FQVIAFRTEARGGERTHVSVDVAFSLQQRTKERKGLLRTTLLEELMGPLYPGGRRRRRCGSGGPFLRHRITAEEAPGRRPSLAGGGAAFPHRRRRRSSRWPTAPHRPRPPRVPPGHFAPHLSSPGIRQWRPSHPRGRRRIRMRSLFPRASPTPSASTRERKSPIGCCCTGRPLAYGTRRQSS